MKRLPFAILFAVTCAAQDSPETALRRALMANTGKITLPAGTIEISREIDLPADAHDLDIRGAGDTVIKAAAGFRGPALLVIPGGRNIRLSGFNIDGNRTALAVADPTPSPEATFSRTVANNGILAANPEGLEIADVRAYRVDGFAVLVNAGSNIRLHDIEISDGSLGGVVLEQGTTDFEIVRCTFGNLKGSGIWVRAGAGSGSHIEGNEFAIVGAAIRADGASQLSIEGNSGHRIASTAPAAIVVSHTAHSFIRNNQFDDFGSLCIAADAFDDGEVSSNECSSGELGGLRLSGSRNKVTGNHYLDLNRARRADIAGISIVAGDGNTISGNEIAGPGMGRRCVAGVQGTPANNVTKNSCQDEAAVGFLPRFQVSPDWQLAILR